VLDPVLLAKRGPLVASFALWGTLHVKDLSNGYRHSSACGRELRMGPGRHRLPEAWREHGRRVCLELGDGQQHDQVSAASLTATTAADEPERRGSVACR
jgi:hypothetical protein